jgi:hypothetical protein
MTARPGEGSRPAACFFLTLSLAIVLASAYLAWRWFTTPGNRTPLVLAWLSNPDDHPGWAVKAGQRCGQAPFLLPTDGFIGYLWADNLRAGHRH